CELEKAPQTRTLFRWGLTGPPGFIPPRRCPVQSCERRVTDAGTRQIVRNPSGAIQLCAWRCRRALSPATRSCPLPGHQAHAPAKGRSAGTTYEAILAVYEIPAGMNGAGILIRGRRKAP